ncbi:MAG: SDR family oxidoreductase [Candidatus Pacebacteria bacterium]|nr:SDR family oxidoreductase [Candidatus Paceibacterota bacterium]
MKLKNKIALITGASGGIGKATALLFAKEGAKVAVNYFSSENEAKSVVEEIQKIGSEAIAIKCDVSDENQVKTMVDQVVGRFGSMDILVNNAGIVFDVPFLERTVEQWKKTLDVNLLGTFLCSKYASEPLKKTSNGKIINISSTNAIDCFSPEAMDYDASKAGIIILTRDLAKELAPEIRVNAIAPGWVDTKMNKDLPQDFIDEEIEDIYLKRFAKPEEIAKAILFLASDDASYITGSILKVDGGHG